MSKFWQQLFQGLVTFTFFLWVVAYRFHYRFLRTATKEENDRIAEMHSRDEDERRERAARKYQSEHPEIPKGSPHPPKREH